MEKIDSFSGEYRFLSNFFPAEVTLDGVRFPTVEHAYQAKKTNIPSERAWIAAAETAAEAKKRGKKVTLTSDWDSVRVDAMRDLIRQKFAHKILRAELLSTGDAELIEGNWWKDTFWGVCNGKGQNMLGKLLMETRKEIQKEVRK